MWPVFLLASGVLVSGLTDGKDQQSILRPPQQASVSPVFSSSIESIPVVASSQQQSVYAKGPNVVHSTASASASASGHGNDPSGGRNNHQWYGSSQGSGFNFDYNNGASDSGSAAASTVSAV